MQDTRRLRRVNVTILRLSTTKTYYVLQRSTMYHKVLLQYYAVQPMTTPVLLRTTKYYSLLQTTTPVLLHTTKDYAVLQSASPHFKIVFHYFI